MQDALKKLETPRVALRIGFGLVPILAGLDKFTYVLADWSAYVAPIARAALPVEPEVFLYAVGIVEVLVGILVLSRWTVLGSYLAAGWLALIAVNLVLAGYFDIAVRDLVLAVAAFTLGRLTEVDEASEGRARQRPDEHAALAA